MGPHSVARPRCVCYAVLCYAMLCYAMLCYAMLRYAMLCYAMLCGGPARGTPGQRRRPRRRPWPGRSIRARPCLCRALAREYGRSPTGWQKSHTLGIRQVGGVLACGGRWRERLGTRRGCAWSSQVTSPSLAISHSTHAETYTIGMPHAWHDGRSGKEWRRDERYRGDGPTVACHTSAAREGDVSSGCGALAVRCEARSRGAHARLDVTRRV
jgi:hypothetical protein